MILGTFVFTDIVKSSILWKKYPKEMVLKIKQHEKRIYKIVKEHKGVVVKTIGDSFMIFFEGHDSYVDGIFCALDIQESFLKKPINFNGKDNISLRIGVCYGHSNPHIVNYQGHKLKDFYGTTVNMASRMESKVSPIDGIAFCFWDVPIPEDFIDELLNYYDVSIIDFKDRCPMNIFNRSGKLIGYECVSTKHLKGVPSIKAFVVSL